MHPPLCPHNHLVLERPTIVPADGFHEQLFGVVDVARAFAVHVGHVEEAAAETQCRVSAAPIK